MKKMQPSRVWFFALLAILFAGLLLNRACPTALAEREAAEPSPAEPNWQLTLRAREEAPMPTNRAAQRARENLTLAEALQEPAVIVTEQTQTLDPRRTALIIIDMWDEHWCKSAGRRIEQMAPRVNELATALRKNGGLIVHAPGGTMRHYENHPAYRMTQAAPAIRTEPRLERRWVHRNRLEEPELPIDFSDGGCDDEPPCEVTRAYTGQIDTIPIRPGDGLGDDVSVYYLLKQRGIENVLIVGTATNMCVLGRPCGIRQLVNQGLNVILVRDLTDAMYNPEMPPHVRQQEGTQLVVKHIERYWTPTITSDQVLGGEPFTFPETSP